MNIKIFFSLLVFVLSWSSVNAADKVWIERYETLNHPVVPILKKHGIRLYKVTYSKDGTCPTFFASYKNAADPRTYANEEFFSKLYMDLFKANSYFPYALVDKEEYLYTNVGWRNSARKIIDIDHFTQTSTCYDGKPLASKSKKNSKQNVSSSEEGKEPALEDYAYIQSGDIYYYSNHETIQLTNTGNDRYPVLSPDKRKVVFVRKEGPEIPERCLTENGKTHSWQIWLYDLVDKKEELLVASNFDCENTKKMIVFPQPNSLIFSSDGKSLYFLTNKSAKSSKAHVVNMATKKEHFIAPANSLTVVEHGYYKDSIIIQQHRYFINGGTYDWYWLFSVDGKEIGPLGAEESVYFDDH